MEDETKKVPLKKGMLDEKTENVCLTAPPKGILLVLFKLLF